MNRNKQFKREKKVIQLQTELNEVWDTIRNQNWVPLDEPFQDGWNITYEVREDIARSKAGRGMSQMIDLSYKTAWSKREDGMVWSRCERRYIEVQIDRYTINSYTYNNLPSYTKKYYHPEPYVSTWHGLWYSPIWIECWKLTRVITPNILTHYQEHDELLYQMESELSDEIDKYRDYAWSYGSTKDDRSFQRRKYRRDDKMKLHKVVKDYNGGDEDVGDDLLFRNGRKNLDNWWW